ncbi:MAG: hypothetical protein QGG36_27050 [Pirellulaceae bacterium]|jgi:hypothetical protein|nr:hypothetical protein [Pirellulaceae bacterium]MDP7019485.1 hypothetical protein [Pirellulaceae bacterium]
MSDIEQRLTELTIDPPDGLRDRTLAAVAGELRAIRPREEIFGARERRGVAAALALLSLSIIFVVAAHHWERTQLQLALGPTPTPRIVSQIADAIGELSPASRQQYRQELTAFVWRPKQNSLVGPITRGG